MDFFHLNSESSPKVFLHKFQSCEKHGIQKELYDISRLEALRLNVCVINFILKDD